MSDFVLKLLNMCLVPFQEWENLLIFVPLVFLVCIGALNLFKRMMKV